ncbi:nucleotidyltransferase family protein [Hyunsoonleella pacifica]|uniref:Nucleotidyltransferase family protein n=1 Tax=Hyunsoonleella pacifica TaxID=1080224 RepID=A0A4Q9FQ77_9FLAO|nr:nucleotidyltransferase family protein [Hyunsoonleella pacifica]TBN17464.1 nucleotidyltransferase family protein [Hyunsoonleella pacifica]GGD11762.1 hypothetical protein GCM10011368_12190 [Hyunsoonleella pacifica]
MSFTSKITIAILAAGASKRMGSPKQLLKWENTTLLKHTIKTCKDTVEEDIVVILGANYAAISSDIKTEAVHIIENENWDLGLGKSIACAAQYCLDSKVNSDGLLIVLADQPFVTTVYLDSMINLFDSNFEAIVATAYNPHKNGVPALFHKNYFKELSELSGDDGAKSLLKKYKQSVKAIYPDFENLDIDTKEDYQHELKRS